MLLSCSPSLRTFAYNIVPILSKRLASTFGSEVLIVHSWGIAMRLIFRLTCAVALTFVGSSSAVSKPMAFYADTSEEHRMFVQIARGGVADVYASGEIDEGTTERFLAYLKVNKIEFADVHFNSPGGSLLEGIRLGRAIRALGFSTHIGVYTPTYVENASKDSVCASACAYAFAGGVSRFLDEYSGMLGVHQFYSSNADVSGETVQRASGLIVAYLDEMGIDAKAFAISTVADRDGMIWLSPEDALELRFANNGVAPPVAEIKLMDMRPYLRVQQEHHNVTTRVLFTCEDRQLHMAFGIVTDPETSQLIMAFPRRSYLELDFKEFLVMPDASGAEATESVVWIGREMTPDSVRRFAAASKVDGWVDGSGAVRWGAQLDVPPVRDKIEDYARQCFNG